MVEFLMARNVGTTRGAKAKADKLFSQLIRSRGWCEKCGESNYSKLQTAHIISRRYSATRCDERNAICLCAKDHYFFTDHPVAFAQWVVPHIGQETYDAIWIKATASTGKVDWGAEVERLKALVSEAA